MIQIKSFFYRSSSFINNVSWDPNSEILMVQFVSGTTWAYHDVPENVYGQLICSLSVGQYFNKNIRDIYSGYRININSDIKDKKNGKKKEKQKEVE